MKDLDARRLMHDLRSALNILVTNVRVLDGRVSEEQHKKPIASALRAWESASKLLEEVERRIRDGEAQQPPSHSPLPPTP